MNKPIKRTSAAADQPRRILVAGDVCLDVVGVPLPPKTTEGMDENWRLTGETRTHFLPGGALLLTEFVRGALGKKSPSTVAGPCALKPRQVNFRTNGTLDTKALLKIAPRLCRDDIVHSLLELKAFPKKPDSKKKDVKTLRIEWEAGFSGPDRKEPSLRIKYKETGSESVILLDDTGNRFRKENTKNPWPRAVASPPEKTKVRPWIIYKLHRPLPGGEPENKLWTQVRDQFKENRIVVVPVEDLRATGVPISIGLSWERTALDVVWQLMNAACFAELRKCPWLVIRLGLDGAIVWRHIETPEKKGKKITERAWLVYDPAGIEGNFAKDVPGAMVGASSAFVAALVARLDHFFVLRDAQEEEEKKSKLKAKVKDKNESKKPEKEEIISEWIEGGLLAARRLFQTGFGEAQPGTNPVYPAAKLFVPRNDKEETKFACQLIPIIPGALCPDRGGWRLLDQIFKDKTSLLHRAVMQLASSRKPPKYEGTDEQSDEAKECRAAKLLKQVPLGIFGKLRTHDRREMEHYRSLHTLLRDYLCNPAPPRPLSFAVFGPPGAGKSFGVKEVAASLNGELGCLEVKELTFNLSLYQSPEELAGAFHLVRDVVLEGKVPLVFFDEFDTALNGEPLGWLRHFLSPMQDGKFLDREAPHPIGQAIFVFAGGTCATFREFSAHPGMEATSFSQRKGPDFLSRLRATLDIPSLNLLTAYAPSDYPQRGDKKPAQPAETFNPFGPIESLPCEAAILLRRAAILSFNLAQKAPGIIRPDESLNVDPAVLRALLFLPSFEHGNRSFEALMDMSHLAGVNKLTPSLLPAEFQVPLHANAAHFLQLVGALLPFPELERMKIAEEIHKRFIEQRKEKGDYDPTKSTHQEWSKLSADDKDSNAEQADDIPRKLLALGLWLRKVNQESDSIKSDSLEEWLLNKSEVMHAARCEHDRWVASKRMQGFVYGPENHGNKELKMHHCILHWDDHRLTKDEKDKDIDTVKTIPRFLAAGRYEVIKP